MDVVYVVGPGDDNEELRYSLRSLANLDHDRVWIAGHCPPWVTGVGQISTVQRYSTANLLAAAVHPEVSESFVYMNDDFFVMQPVDEVPMLHRGLVVDVIADYRASGLTRGYVNGMVATGEFLERLGFRAALSYELHLPMVLDKARFAEVVTLPHRHGVQIRALHKRTLYGNFCELGGTRTADVKVCDAWPDAWSSPDQPFVSTSAEAWRQIGHAIRGRFPDRCAYERS